MKIATRVFVVIAALAMTAPSAHPNQVQTGSKMVTQNFDFPFPCPGCMPPVSVR